MADPSQLVVDLNSAILESRGHRLNPGSAILDYGCGSGRHVYEYLDAGYSNVCGYDVKDYVVARTAEDKARFRFEPTGSDPEYPSMSHIPWPDDTFDFIFATQVFEHVRDYAKALAEIARVLKPGGMFLNVFPSKWRPIEPHMFVPFGGVITSRPYFWFWATLGIRNEGQKGASVSRVVELNREFSELGVNYLSGRQIDAAMRPFFASHDYVEDAFIKNGKGRSRLLATPIALFRPLRRLYRAMHSRVILATK